MEPNDELPLDVQLRHAEERLHMCNALDEAFRDPRKLMELMTSADDPDHARAALREHFGFDEFQAAAVMDLQFRRGTKLGRIQIAQQRQELSEYVNRLRDLAAQEGE